MEEEEIVFENFIILVDNEEIDEFIVFRIFFEGICVFGIDLFFLI